MRNKYNRKHRERDLSKINTLIAPEDIADDIEMSLWEIKEVFDIISETNAYVDKQAPWSLKKTNTQRHLSFVLLWRKNRCSWTQRIGQKYTSTDHRRHRPRLSW